MKKILEEKLLDVQILKSKNLLEKVVLDLNDYFSKRSLESLKKYKFEIQEARDEKELQFF